MSRVNSLETPAAAFGARAEGALPVRVSLETPPTGAQAIAAKRSRLGTALRVVRDAAIAVAIIAMIPLGLVSTRGDRVWGNGDAGANVRARVARAEAMRPWALPTDASITPMQAGLALAMLQKAPQFNDFSIRAGDLQSRATWRDVELKPGMFAKAPTKIYNGPSSQLILGQVASGFSAQETAYLRTLATAPVWRDFDLIARAPAVDIVGGRFRLPFAAGASAADMPTPDMAALRELANAAVARAAYHLSLGQKDSAEAVLRAIVSVGFALIDNGTSFMDEFTGNVIVGIGRDVLQRYYTAVGDPRAASPALRLGPSISTVPQNQRTVPINEVRASMIARIGDPTIHRGERYELLRRLAQSSCTNVPELLFGPRSDVTDALAKARTDLARYPSEQALVDLMASTPRPKVDFMMHGPVDMLVVSAGTVVGTIVNNPRLAACARTTTAFQFNY